MHSCRVMALLIGAVSLCSCDLIVDKIREGANGNAPGGGGSSSGPTPPPNASSDAAAPPVLPPPPPPSRCQDWTGAGDETTCKSQDEWKRYAYDACLAQNLILNDYGVGGGDCGAGMTRMVKYQCCAPAPSVPSDPGNSGTPGTPPGTTTPPGPTTPPAPNRCADIVVAGDETTCRSQDEWKLYAYEACQAQMLSLNDYGVGGGDCAPGKTRQVKYQCCGPVPPDPGNSGSGGGSGTPGSTPGTGSGGTSGTGGGSCTGGGDGSPSSCKSVATWRQYATETCTRQNLVLTDIAFGESCGTDFYRYSRFVCCPGK